MAGTLTLSTLSDGTNSTSSTNPILGSAKSWVNFDGVTSVTVRNSFNVSSVTRAASGNYTINFTNALPNANYCIAGSTDYEGVTVNQAINLQNNSNTTSSSQVLTTTYDGLLVDNANINVVFFSS